MRTWDSVAIIGVGLIGGSIGLALRGRKLARQIVGIGRSQASLDKAIARGCIAEATTNLAEGVQQAELVVVCSPVELIAQHVRDAARHCPPGCLITDAGSTKAQIVDDAEAALAARFPGGLPYVGSHPLAGSEKNGATAAAADLFADRIVVVTPTSASSAAAVVEIEAFWQSLGARVVQMSPAEHDAVLAHTSHLPHLLASALAAATPEELLPLTAAGWQDTTRIAAGEAELWRQIFLATRACTLKALADFETVLARLRSALEAADGPLLAELLTEGKRRRDAVGS
jgi:prephenate dehydrogenase